MKQTILLIFAIVITSIAGCKKDEPLTDQNPITGCFFHTLNENEKIQFQGMVIGQIETGFYLVQLFDWLMGEPSIRKVVRVEEMTVWLLYESSEQMNYSWEHGTARKGGTYRD